MKNHEKEISLLDMILYICQRWRLLTICLIIGAVVFGIHEWTKSGNSNVTIQITGDDINGIPID